ncbi:unnamed protein product [Linum trigynum]|uniref:Uncharacterized protein n=1 Tax=Linum trigynum TaxID=586398 RepID=A0AAV2CAK1_9ROSI
MMLPWFAPGTATHLLDEKTQGSLCNRLYAAAGSGFSALVRLCCRFRPPSWWWDFVEFGDAAMATAFLDVRHGVPLTPVMMPISVGDHGGIHHGVADTVHPVASLNDGGAIRGTVLSSSLQTVTNHGRFQPSRAKHKALFF